MKRPLLLLLYLGAMTSALYAQSPYIYKVWEYRPAPGQFVNELPKYEEGDDANDMRLKAEESIEGTSGMLVSLGGYGGYITFGFDHMVENVKGKYDFKILANAFYANANPNPDAPAEGGSCEPGIVMVSYDANGNGRPDDPWYELAGSEYGSDKTVHNYRCTYYKPDEDKIRVPQEGYEYINDMTYIRWTDNVGGEGYVARNTFHDQSYWPQWLDGEELVFEGTKLADNYVDESGNGSYYVLYSYPWGYVDNHPNNDERSNFNIEWAVDGDGNRVDLPGIHFVKVYTGVNQYCGWLGETSTEITGAYDLHMMLDDPSYGGDGTEIVLNLEAPDDPIEYNEKKYWAETYNTSEEFRHLKFGLFSFTHCIHAFGGTDVGGGMSYWDGFTVSKSGDNTNYGSSGSSDGWIPEQWGVMAGGGVADDGSVDPNRPYLVAYWGYWEEEKHDNVPACQVDFTDGKAYRPQGVYVCNHPWPYYGNIYGDGFARPFTEADDSFKLYIHGIDSEGKDTGVSVEYVLADTEPDGSGGYKVRQSPEWQWVDLTALGEVYGLYFTMSSTDSDPIYGMNTACYFCIDRLTVTKVESKAPGRPTGLNGEATETTIEVSWNPPAEGEVSAYNVYLNDKYYNRTTHNYITISQLQPYTLYSIGVEAEGGNGELSDQAKITVRTTDETAPSEPVDLAVTTKTAYSITIAWQPAGDNVAVTQYVVYVNGIREKRINDGSFSYTITGLDPDTEYTIGLEARDAAGNTSGRVEITAITDSQSSIDGIEAETERSQIYGVDGRQVYKPTRGIYLIKRGNKYIKHIIN